MGRFMWRASCACDSQVWFRRGHEHCDSLPKCFELAKAERRQKRRMAQRLVLDRSMYFTDLDFLLNTRQFERAGVALMTIRKALRQRYRERMLTEDGSAAAPPVPI